MKPSVILFGSKPGASVVLNVLIERNWYIKYVVPSKHISDVWLKNNKIADIAYRNNIPVIKQKDIPLDIEVDFLISYMYRYRITNRVLSLPKKAALNFHPHPLPDYAGYGGYNKAILDEVKEFGCTCHHMVEEFDAGPIVKINRFPINHKEETAYSLEQKSQEEMIRLFINFCDMAESNQKISSIPQKKLKKNTFDSRSMIDSLRKIPDNADIDTVDKYARAFWFPPFEGAYLKIKGKKIEVMPDIVKEEIGNALHINDFFKLKKISELYCKNL